MTRKFRLKRPARRLSEPAAAPSEPDARRGHVEGRGRKGQGGDFSRATVFLPRPTRELLAQHGIRHSMSLQEIVEAALDEWLARQGYPPFYPDGWSRSGKSGTGSSD